MNMLQNGLRKQNGQQEEANLSDKQITYDIDGYEAITPALMDLLNQFPGLMAGEKISFSTIDGETGIGMYPVSGAVVEQQRRSVTGMIEEVCLYPFFVVYKAGGLSESRKAEIKESLDNLGKWLERKEITLAGDRKYKLTDYPKLTGERTILTISRQTPAYLNNTDEDMGEAWEIYLSVRYRNKYKAI